MFQLSHQEMEIWKSQIVTSNPSMKMGLRKRPYAFTEHGAIMAANVLKSRRARQMSVFVVRAFIRMRSLLSERHELVAQLPVLEKTLTHRLDTHESAIVDVLRRVLKLLEPIPSTSKSPRRRIGFQSM